jgi:hypothetical protein
MVGVCYDHSCDPDLYTPREGQYEETAFEKHVVSEIFIIVERFETLRNAFPTMREFSATIQGLVPAWGL